MVDCDPVHVPIRLSPPMNIRIPALLAGSIALGLTASTSSAQIASYSEDFEGLVQTDPDALANAGWLVFGNVFEAVPYCSFPVEYLVGFGGGNGFLDGQGPKNAGGDRVGVSVGERGDRFG